MFDVLAEYVTLVTAKKVDGKRAGYVGGARPLVWIAGLLVVGLVLLGRYVA
ncbi:MAG: hypothetical protein QFF03_15445 [Pseudomonadota bacterium]|nr:hypothetical protein [Pseudomonadota bacterium]